MKNSNSFLSLENQNLEMRLNKTTEELTSLRNQHEQMRKDKERIEKNLMDVNYDFQKKLDEINKLKSVNNNIDSELSHLENQN